MPLFQFARLNRIPMIALNVEQKLVARVGQQGWENVPASEREGLSDPAPASPAYQRELAHVYLIKKAMPPGADPFASAQGPGVAEPDDAAVEEAMKQPEFKRFVEAQLTWDRAMAEALASAKRKFSNATIVGILGSGHVEGGYGVPHQLMALGITQATSLLPVPADAACMLVGTSFADAVFTLPHTDEAPNAERPRLGVALVDGDGAPRINRVVDNSVAQIAGLKVGDQVVRAAGLTIRKPDELVEVIARQAPGTWLPLSVRRDGQDIDLIAKFPTSARSDQ
jgi:membrane-associated protease RseP (regulator of RpoE activity)